MVYIHFAVAGFSPVMIDDEKLLSSSNYF